MQQLAAFEAVSDAAHGGDDGGVAASLAQSGAQPLDGAIHGTVAITGNGNGNGFPYDVSLRSSYSP